jgi:uncharacterized protein YukE
VRLRYSADLWLASSVLTSLDSCESTLDEVVRDLRLRVRRMHEVFEGQSALAHLERHAAWSASYEEMQEALRDMRRAVRTARDNYSSAASANLELWRSVR